MGPQGYLDIGFRVLGFREDPRDTWILSFFTGVCSCFQGCVVSVEILPLEAFCLPCPSDLLGPQLLPGLNRKVRV